MRSRQAPPAGALASALHFIEVRKIQNHVLEMRHMLKAGPHWFQSGRRMVPRETRGRVSNAP